VTPLALMGVYLLVFGLLWSGNDIRHYPIYLLAGLVCWLLFSVSLQVAARSLLDSAELVKKVRFPRQLVPFSAVATQPVTLPLILGVLIVLSRVFIPEAATTAWLPTPLAPLVGFSSADV